MEQIFIKKMDGTVIPLANRSQGVAIKQATQTWELLGADMVNVSIDAPLPQEYRIGDRITVFGRTYSLNRLPSARKTGSMAYSYNLEFEGMQYALARATFDLTIDTTKNKLQDVKADSLTGDLRRFATVLISNANRVFPDEWVLGSCPDTDGDKTLNFGEADNCLSVLHNLCSTFEVEYEIVQKDGTNTIHFIKKVGRVFPFAFEFGRGRGLYSLERQNVDSSNVVTRLKVYGSTQNITNKYRANRLCLPNKNKGQSYIEDKGISDKFGIFEATKYFDSIKPTFDGKVTAIYTDNVLKFRDDNMFDLNEKEADGKTTKYLLPGVAAKIHFNTGNLAGYEFNVQKYDHATRTFTIIKLKDERGDEFPSKVAEAFQIAEGDKYKILDVTLPQRYIDEAEAKLQTESDIYYKQNSQPKVKYGLSISKEYLRNLVGGSEGVNIFSPGDYIPVKDKSLNVDKSVRIKSLVRNLFDPYAYTLTISDTVSTNIVNRVISDMVEKDKIVQTNHLDNPARARNNWRTSQELMDMVFDPEGDYYTDKIKPNSIDTLALSVGAKSMQFGLTDTMFQPNYEGNENVIKVKGGTLTHYTIDENNLRVWNLSDNTTTFVDDEAYYIYAKCQRNGSSGFIIFSKNQIKPEQDPMFYHFWIGVVNSVDSTLQARSVSLSYGFSTINGKFVRTGKITSTNGKTYFDLDNGEIGGRIKFLGSNGEYSSAEDLIKNSIDDIEVGTENLLINTELGTKGSPYLDGAISGGNTLTFYTDKKTGAGQYIILRPFSDIYYRFSKLTDRQTLVVTPGADYVFSGKIFVPEGNGFTPNLQVLCQQKGYPDWRDILPLSPLPSKIGEWCDFEVKFTIPKNATAFCFGFQVRFGGDARLGAYFLAKDLMFARGNKAAVYRPHRVSTKYITDAIQNGSTDINGGLVLSNLMFARGADGVVRSGISGIASDNVSFFGGGTYQNALLDAGKEFKSPMSVGALDKKDGSGHRAFGKFAWDKHGQLYAKGTIEATAGKIGDYEIVGGNITGRTEGEERFLLTLNDLPQKPTQMTNTEVVAFDSGWGEGTLLKADAFYMNIGKNDEITYLKESDSWSYDCEFQVPEATKIRVSFGVSPESFVVSGHFPDDVISGSERINIQARAYLNGNPLGEIRENTDFTIPSLGIVKIELYVRVSVRLKKGNRTVFWKLVSVDSLRVVYKLPTKKTCIGADGLYSYYSDLEYLFFKRGYGLAVRGNTDMPGILLSGCALAAGGARNLWGAKKSLGKVCERVSEGVYKVYHSVGHSNYSVQATPKGTHKVANVDWLYEDHFIVNIYEIDGGQKKNSDFFFTIIGNN